MNKYIFLTYEWSTIQPNWDDIENVQMIWIWEWSSKNEAFIDLKIRNEWLMDTSFDEIFCHELKDSDYDYFYLKK